MVVAKITNGKSRGLSENNCQNVGPPYHEEWGLPRHFVTFLKRLRRS